MEKGENYSYVFQSGKYQGSSLVSVMIKDPIHVARIYQAFLRGDTSVKNPNHLQLAIESLLEKIKRLDTTKMCPYCKERKVKYFLLPDFGPVSTKLVCCHNALCQEELRTCRVGELHEINDFFSLVSVPAKTQARQLLSLFRQTHKNLIAEISA